ncbi:DUF742 domain-containing protein [Actinomadura alba]|uniref:DUF742 domain-containing protein n=1 Tax=Actinomadura alba TaxID=406431 RepID=A0ABR7LYB6_9ACTN|nr:DUF742 domain-containing protein [Actinomadura alba]MBC6469838.1 DUF742 domain-containing protein [Actinomadura alba]
MRSSEEFDDERWLDEHAGPLVRPYVMTRGRILPIRGKFDLISLIVTVRPVPMSEVGFGPEHLAIVDLCHEMLSVAEIAGRLDLPVGTVRVLLGDLLHRGFIAVEEPQPEVNMSDEAMYEAVLDGLRTL